MVLQALYATGALTRLPLTRARSVELSMLLVIRRVLEARVVPPDARALSFLASRLRLSLSRSVFLSRVSELVVSRVVFVPSRDVLLSSRPTVLPSVVTLLAKLPRSLRLKILLFRFSVLVSVV